MIVLLILIVLAAVAGIFLLTRAMHRLALRVQFGVLLGLGVTIGFLFLMMVQMPRFPTWLGISMITVVFVASLFGSRIFLRSLIQEERDEEERVRREASGEMPPDAYPNLDASQRSSHPR